MTDLSQRHRAPLADTYKSMRCPPKRGHAFLRAILAFHQHKPPCCPETTEYPPERASWIQLLAASRLATPVISISTAFSHFLFSLFSCFSVDPENEFLPLLQSLPILLLLELLSGAKPRLLSHLNSLSLRLWESYPVRSDPSSRSRRRQL